MWGMLHPPQWRLWGEMGEMMYISNFEHATDEQRCRAVFEGLKMHETKYPNIIGDKFYVATDEQWAKNTAMGMGSTALEAWEDCYCRFAGEIWEAIRNGQCVRHLD